MPSCDRSPVVPVRSHNAKYAKSTLEYYDHTDETTQYLPPIGEGILKLSGLGFPIIPVVVVVVVVIVVVVVVV